MSVQSYTVVFLVITMSLIVVKGFVISDAIASSTKFRDIALEPGSGFNNTTELITTQQCIRSDQNIFERLIDASLGVLIKIINANRDVCLQKFDFLSGNTLILGLGGLLVSLGGLTLLGGFLTAGASRGGIAMTAYGLIIGGATGIALSLVEPLFNALPIIGVPLFIIYSVTGFVLTLYSGLNYLAGA